ncbi:MAG TPA: hypothetical protein PLC98_20520 [Anaerolineales bacterium]|nr:hypothetical protein [Anaerolineales bacterium]
MHPTDTILVLQIDDAPLTLGSRHEMVDGAWELVLECVERDPDAGTARLQIVERRVRPELMAGPEIWHAYRTPSAN